MQNEVIGKILDKTLDNIRNLMDGDIVVGKELYAPDGSLVIPVSKVSLGMVSGGGEYGIQSFTGDHPGAGAGGAGLTVTPMGFLVLGKLTQRFVSIENKEETSKWIGIVESVSKIFSKKKSS